MIDYESIESQAVLSYQDNIEDFYQEIADKTNITRDKVKIASYLFMYSRNASSNINELKKQIIDYINSMKGELT